MTLHSIIQSLADLVAPPLCVCCGRRLSGGERVLCAACNIGMPRRRDLLSPADNSTVRLLWGRADIERGAAWADYVPATALARAIYAMKYGGRRDIARVLGQMAAVEMSASGMFDGIDAVVPLPLHPARQRQRGYNQSLEIGAAVAAVAGLELCGSAVARLRNTPSQAAQAHNMRAANVHGAFGVPHPELLDGRHVLLVDDIITTGASLAECAHAMQAAAQVRVSFLTIGRTVQ